MKAIVVREFGGPDVLKLEDVPDPSPGPGQVLVRVKAAGVNPVDTYVRSGTYAIKPPLPYTPGRDLAGTIEAVGPDVATWKRGDRVYSDGAGQTSGAYAGGRDGPRPRRQRRRGHGCRADRPRPRPSRHG